MFSASLNKYSGDSDFITQKRTLLITTERVINLNYDALKRAIMHNEIKGVTKSTVDDNFEIIIHVRDESDYRYDCLEKVLRDETITALKECHYYSTNENLPIFGIDTKTLKMTDF